VVQGDEDGEWRAVSSAAQYEQLMTHLNPDGAREAVLQAQLGRVKGKLLRSLLPAEASTDVKIATVSTWMCACAPPADPAVALRAAPKAAAAGASRELAVKTLIRAPGDDARLAPADLKWLDSMSTAAYRVRRSPLVFCCPRCQRHLRPVATHPPTRACIRATSP
jgi:hypothetical protein